MIWIVIYQEKEDKTIKCYRLGVTPSSEKVQWLVLSSNELVISMRSKIVLLDINVLHLSSPAEYFFLLITFISKPHDGLCYSRDRSPSHSRRVYS